MNIKIAPETDQLLTEELRVGHFLSVDELIVSSVLAWREKNRHPKLEGSQQTQESLREVFAKIRGLAEDVDFSRDPSTGRLVDL